MHEILILYCNLSFIYNLSFNGLVDFLHYKKNKDAAHPDPYENIVILLPYKSSIFSIKLTKPAYKAPV